MSNLIISCPGGKQLPFSSLKFFCRRILVFLQSIDIALKVALVQIMKPGDHSFLFCNIFRSCEYSLSQMHDPNNTLYFFLGRLWQQNVSVILGPVETCVHEVNNNQSQLAQALQELVVTHVQARMAAAFNLPMLSYYCQHAETSDKVAFPTFIRTR